MIYSVRGKLTHIDANLAVVECGGVGYACKTTATTLNSLPRLGSEATLYTYLHITENALDLFGFFTILELSYFKMILTVSGVGPKAALAILSDLTPERLAVCIAAGDYKTITRAPGVGPKLAQRILLELKDRVADEDLAFVRQEQGGGGEGESSAVAQALSALVALGYSRGEAASALAKADPVQPVEELIKTGLKKLSAQK